jgi:3-hydroxyacyl-[acyl-carrier-protein] dehydratase
MDGGSGVSKTKTTLETADIRDILKFLPHRYPLLMIDRVTNIDGDSAGIGVKNVTINEPQFQGHFPGEPVMPGVLLIEGMAQTAGVLCVIAQGLDAPRLVYFMTIDKAKFRKPVVPGDVVEYHMTKERQRGSIWRFHGEAMVGDQVVAQADVSAMIVRDD